MLVLKSFLNILSLIKLLLRNLLPQTAKALVHLNLRPDRELMPALDIASLEQCGVFVMNRISNEYKNGIC